MAYITLEELKEILPKILTYWIDKDDESWEWIFQEIEQKCHIGKKSKKKKKVSKIEAIEITIMAHRNDINELTKKVDELNNRINNLNERHVDLTSRVNRIYSDVTAAKSMAETAKQRTEVDYTKCSQTDNKYKIRKCDQPITAANKCGSCKHLSKLSIDQPCIGCCYNGMNISGMDKWEAKENE